MQRTTMTVLLIALAQPLHGQVSRLTSVIDTKGKFPVVRVTGEAPMWRLDSIATLADSGDVGFTRIYSLLIDPRGGVMVMPAKPPAINRYDDHGKLLTVIGRLGSGPKEYRRAVGSGWIDGDLVVFDPDNGRVIRWNPAGEWVAQWTAIHGCCDLRMIFPAGPSHVWMWTSVRLTATTGGRAYIRVPATGHNDTIRAPALPARLPGGLDCPWGNGSIEIFSYPFASPVYQIAPTAAGNFVEMSGLGYRIAIRSPLGDTLRVIEHVVPAVPITDREWADSTREYRDFMAKHSGVSCNRGMDRPSAKAAVHSFELDERGRIWVERNVAGGLQWDVWDGDRLVGTVRGVARRTWAPMEIRGDRMVVSRASDDGGVVAVLYRISERP